MRAPSLLLVSLIACSETAAPPSGGLDSVGSAADHWSTSTLATPIESAHPYLDDTDLEERVEGPAGSLAIKLKIHLAVEQDYDFVEILAADGTLIQRFTGTHDGWTDEIPGHLAQVHLTSDGSIDDFGFSVSAIQVKTGATPPPPPSSGAWTEFSAGGVSTAHPYRNSTDKTFTVTAVPEATRVRLELRGFDLEDDYDFAVLEDAAGAEVARYSGALGDFTSAEVAGNVARIRFTSDGSVTRFGFDLLKYEALIPSGGGGGGGGGGHGGRGDACDAATAPCASGLVCASELNSSLGGVCAAPTWGHHPIPFARATAHPYLDNAHQSFEVFGPSWASKIKVGFTGFDTESGYDYASVQANGQEIGKHTGRLGDFNSAEVPASSATVVFTSDESVEGSGFEIRAVEAYGVPDRLVAISIDPRQCSSDRFPTATDPLLAYLRSLGVTVYGLRRSSFTSMVCSACSCPTGERIVVLIAAEDAYAVKDLSRNTGVYSVQQGDNVFAGRLIKLTTTPKQCGSNAWDTWCAQSGSSACGSTIDSRVRAWAASLGASVYALQTPLMREQVCSGCACAMATDLVIGVPDTQATIMEAQGFHR